MSRGEIPELKRPGRRKSRISREERSFIMEMHERYRVGSVALEKKIERIHKKEEEKTAEVCEIRKRALDEFMAGCLEAAG